MFATESGHFFYDRADRDTFIKNSEKHEKPVNFTAEDFEESEEITFEKFPGVAVLKKHGLDSIEKLKACEDLSKVPNLGAKKVEQIKELLKNFD